MFANARMYALNPQIEALWRELFAAVGAAADAPVEYLVHAAPAPLAALWHRGDLACAFICGFPWATWHDAEVARPLALAAPVPLGAPGPATYHSDIVVRAEAPFTDFDALLGRRMAWTVVESQSGYQALRTWLAPRADGKALFAATIGPLVTPRRVVEAVLAGEADAGPLDSYWHALLRRHEPGLAARLRVVAQTPSTPMPLLVVTATIDAPVRERWCAALLDVGARADLRPVLEALQLQGFAAVDDASYQTLAERAALADRLGYTRLA